MLHSVHGEVHGGMEHSQQAVYWEDTAGECKEFRWWGDVLNSVIELGKGNGIAALDEEQMYEYGKCTTSLCTMTPGQGDRPNGS